jgi:hypothetical protein
VKRAPSDFGNVSFTETRTTNTIESFNATSYSDKYFWFWKIHNTEYGLTYYANENPLIINISEPLNYDWNITAYFGNCSVPFISSVLPHSTIKGDINFDGTVNLLNLNPTVLHWEDSKSHGTARLEIQRVRNHRFPHRKCGNN